MKGDKNRVVIGQYTSIGDRAVVQCSTSANLETGFPAVMEIGSYCNIGPGSVLTSCIVEDDVVVGPGAIIQEGSVVKCRSVVMAGSVVLPHTVIENYQMWAGNPAVHVRDLDDNEIKNIRIVSIYNQPFVPIPLSLTCLNPNLSGQVNPSDN